MRCLSSHNVQSNCRNTLQHPNPRVQVATEPGVSELPAGLLCAFQPPLTARQSLTPACISAKPCAQRVDTVVAEMRPIYIICTLLMVRFLCQTADVRRGTVTSTNGGAVCTCRYHSFCGNSRTRQIQLRTRRARRKSRQSRWSSSKVGDLCSLLLSLVMQARL
jgi:hypothetical protein